MSEPNIEHAALVAEMVRVLGEETALQADLVTQAHRMCIAAGGASPWLAEDYDAQLAVVARMGKDFEQRFLASLQRLTEAAAAAHTAAHRRMHAMMARIDSGEPLVSERDVERVLDATKKG